MGHDFSKVRVHTDANAANSAHTLHARAYAIGHDVGFGRGEYSPERVDGLRVLIHELVHVVQQDRTGIPALAGLPDEPTSTPTNPAERVATDLAGDLTLRPSPMVAGILGSLELSGFDTLRATLKPAHLALLASFVGTATRLLRAYPGGMFMITGHTDATGSERVNEPLGKERADQVAEALKTGGVPAEAIRAVGVASSDPAVPAKGSEARNRRVVIRFQQLPMGLGISSLRPPAQPIFTPRVSLIPITPPMETPEQRLSRILREQIPPGPPRRSLSEAFWNRVDDKLNSAMRSAGVPDWMQGPIRDGAHAAIERLAEAPFSQALANAGVAPNAREAILSIVRAAMAEPTR